MDRLRFLAVPLLPLLVAACGEEGSSANGASCPNVTPTVAGALDGFDLAVAQARDRSVPLLALVRPPHSQCPPADRLEGLLRATPGLEARCAFVVCDGGPTAGEDERLLVRRVRLGASVPPLLVVASPELEILHVQVSGLMPYYDLSGEPMAHSPGPLFTGQDVLAMLERVESSLKATDARLAGLGSPTDPETEVERVELLATRGRWEAATSTVSGLDPGTLSMQQVRRLFDVLVRVGAREQARSLAKGVLAVRPDAKGAGWLELGLLWHFEQNLDGLGLERLGLQIESAQKAGCRALEIALRAVRVRVLSRTRPTGGSPLADDLKAVRAASRELFAKHVQDGPHVLSLLAEAAMLRSDYPEAERLIVQLDGDYPDTGEAVRFRHGTFDRVQRRQDGPLPLPASDRPRPDLPQSPR